MYVLIKDLRRSGVHLCANKGLTAFTMIIFCPARIPAPLFSITYNFRTMMRRLESRTLRAFHFGNYASSRHPTSLIPRHQSQRVRRRALQSRVAELRRNPSSREPFWKLILIIITGHLPRFARRNFHQRVIPVRSVRHHSHARPVCGSHRFDAARRAGLFDRPNAEYSREKSCLSKRVRHEKCISFSPRPGGNIRLALDVVSSATARSALAIRKSS